MIKNYPYRIRIQRKKAEKGVILYMTNMTQMSAFQSYLNLLLACSNIIIKAAQMGSRLSVHIETPLFQAQQWEYVPESESNPQEYGCFRTLRHKRTGQKIDQFDVTWSSEEEFLYYLKSFNWRSRQPNVVQSRYIVQRNQQEICSYNYMASIYVEHIHLRLSEINDIPYPDNLYMLMEALEGYGVIYEHSKYFLVEENQICVDEEGAVKVWVNSDLSINYPAIFMDGEHNLAEEDMAEAVINLIADNTDTQTEPQPTFREYYQQKKGKKGKNFQQARSLVFTYARLNNTEIPSRFEAIFNITQEEIDVKTFTQQSLADRKQRANQLSGLRVGHPVPFEEKQLYAQSLGMKQPILANTIYASSNPSSYPISLPTQQHPIHISFGSKSQKQLLPSPQNTSQIYMPVPVQSEIYWASGSQLQSGIPRFQGYYRSTQAPLSLEQQSKNIESIVESEPFNSNLESNSGMIGPNRRVSLNDLVPEQQVSYFVPNSRIAPANKTLVNTNNMFTAVPHIDAQSYLIPPNKHKTSAGLPQSTIMEEENANRQDEAIKDNWNQSNSGIEKDEFASLEGSHIHLENSIKNNQKGDEKHEQETIKFQNRNDVTKSVPLQGYPVFNRRQLSVLAEPNKAELPQNNPSGIASVTFGDRSQLKEKFKSTMQKSVKPFKYYSNLYEQLEIDPMIAADLAKLS